jgi:hypothetical protein
MKVCIQIHTVDRLLDAERMVSDQSLFEVKKNIIRKPVGLATRLLLLYCIKEQGVGCWNERNFSE